MESFVTLLLILLSVTTAVVIVYQAIYSRKRQQQTQPKAKVETRPTVIAEHPIAAQEPQSTLLEETPLTAVAEAAQPTIAREAELIEGEEQRPEAVLEESQLITSGKPPQTAPVEAPLTTPGETEQIVVEAQSTVVHEAQLLAGKETQLAAEQAQSTAVGVTPHTPERKSPKPGERGGRPRASTRDREKQQEHKARLRTLKPEIVCWKRERQWILAVQVPEELIESPDLAVLQNSLPLSRDELEETCWRLEGVVGEVIVRWNEDEARIGLGQEKYLLFKLSGQNLDQGRLVKFPFSGSYLVIAPDDWKRDETFQVPRVQNRNM
ncbi:MAG: hypothetical protein NZL98_08635 [Anaerolineales bacterium]|nr:hypothetical protein [Anaerolineales bacterium]